MNLTTAEAPHGGDFRLSRTNGTALIDTWEVSCNLWTPHDVEVLPLRYTFLVDVGDASGEIRIRDTGYTHELSGFVLPSSRATVPDPRTPPPETSEGWILCRRNCPATMSAEVLDMTGAKARVEKSVELHRWSCGEGADQYNPCNQVQMLAVIEGLLRAIDVQAADLQSINYILLLIALELSDLPRFDLPAEDGAQPPDNRNPLFSGAVLDPRQLGTGRPQDPIVTRRRARASRHAMQPFDPALPSVFDVADLQRAIAQDIADALDMDAETFDVVRTESGATTVRQESVEDQR